MKIYVRIGIIIYAFMKPFLGLVFSGKLRTRALIVHDSQILLVRNWIGNQEWAMPGGGVKSVEKPEDALARELEEELRLNIRDQSLKLLLEDTHVEATAKFPVAIYALELSKKLAFRAHQPEILEAKWFDIDKLPENTSKLVGKAVKTYR